MAKTSEKNKPALWKRIVASVKAGIKGGKAGQWSARKAQIAVQLYKKAGGGYKGKKAKDNALNKWTKEDWGYVADNKEGRYLPKKAREALTPGEKRATNAKKKKDTKRGKQFSSQPEAIAKKTAKYRKPRKG